MPSSFDLRSLLEFSRLLNRQDDLDRVYSAYLLSLLGKLRVTRGVVATRDEGSDRYTVTHARGRASRLLSTSFAFDLPDDFVEVLTLDREGSGLFPDGMPEEMAQFDLHYVMPVRFDNTTFALTFLGDPVVGAGFATGQESYAMAISTITAIAVEGVRVRSSLHDTNRRLERRVHRLRSVFESSRAFGGTLQSSEIIRLLGYTLMGEMALAKFALYLREGTHYRPTVNRFRDEFEQVDLRRVMEGEGVVIDPEEWSRLYEGGVRAALPLRSQGETEGVLLLGKRLQYDIDVEDLEYLGALGGIAIASLENARLLEEMIEKRRMEEDLRIAWEIQQQLLPPVPEIPGYSVAAGTLPAQEVGGDCYDMIRLPDGRFLMTIADVSGKGAPASLLMANVQAALRALAPLDLPLPELAARVNDLVHDNTAADKFITAFLLRLNPENGEVEYVNAGHNPPFFRVDRAARPNERAVQPLVEGGLILGVMPTTIPYESGQITINPGEMIVMYTDGVTEAMNRVHEEYGEDRLTELLLAVDDKEPDAEKIYQQIIVDLEHFADGARRSDDITVICLGRKISLEA